MGELVIGRRGENHVSSSDIAAMLRGLSVTEDVILTLGGNMECTVLSANSVEVASGGCMLQSHFYRMPIAEQVSIQNGTTGYKRNDLVGIRYTLGDGNIQDGYLDVIKGTATVGTPSDPEYPTGSIDDGDVEVFFPLWRIPIDGLTVGEPERMMEVIGNPYAEMKGVAAIATSGAHVGRNIADIPEIQDEIEEHGGVAQFLYARAAALDSSYLRVGDYVDITHTSIGGTRRYLIGDFWPYLGLSYVSGSTRPGHIVMVSEKLWPTTCNWAEEGENSTLDNNQPGVLATWNSLYNAMSSIYSTFPQEWKDVMQENGGYFPYRQSGGSNDTGHILMSWGYVWAPSETEVFGCAKYGTAVLSEGSDCQFEIFKHSSGRVKSSTNISYWTRNAVKDSTKNACDVSSILGTPGQMRVDRNGYALPCFMVGPNA